MKDDPEVHGRLVVARSSTGDQACSEVAHEVLENSSPELPDRTVVVGRAVAPSASPVLPEIAAGPSSENMEFSVYEPEKEFQTIDVPHPQDLQVPKSEFSMELDLEEVRQSCEACFYFLPRYSPNISRVIIRKWKKRDVFCLTDVSSSG